MSVTSETKSVRLPDGGRLSYRMFGRADRGPPILLLRPLGGSMALWGRFADCLAIEHEVIAFDPRGVAGSSDPPFLQTTRDMARDALALIDALAVDRVHVFGLSLGGMVATWFALDAAHRVQRLILASTLPRATSLSQRARRVALPLLRAFLRSGVDAETALVHEILSPQFRVAHPDRVRAIEQIVRAHPTARRNLAALALTAARHHAGDALRRIAAPTLVMVGELDPLVGKRADAELLHEIPHATLAVIPGSGHDVSLEQPEATARQVADFVRGE